MENHLYIVTWGGQCKVMAAPDMDSLWKRIRRNYYKGCVVTIEDADGKKTYIK